MNGGIEVRWEDPPARKNAIFTTAVLEELRSQPERWALIRTYPRSRGRRTDISHPCDIELLWKYHDGQLRLYARSVG